MLRISVDMCKVVIDGYFADASIIFDFSLIKRAHGRFIVSDVLLNFIHNISYIVIWIFFPRMMDSSHRKIDKVELIYRISIHKLTRILFFDKTLCFPAGLTQFKWFVFYLLGKIYHITFNGSKR